MKRSLTTLFTSAALLAGLLISPLAPAAQAKEESKAAGAAASKSPVILLQSEIAGSIVCSSGAVIVKSKEYCHILTSYEAVKGAARITALAAGSQSVPAKLLRFAPEANLALLEVPIPNLPAARIGDSEILKADTPVQLSIADPIKEGAMASSFMVNERKGTVMNIINRPTGSVLRLKFQPGIEDETSGAPVFDSSGTELLGIALSNEAAENNSGVRFAIPIALASAISNDIKSSSDSVANIQVRDGSEAPVLESLGGTPSEDEEESGNGWIFIVGAAVIVGIGAVVVLRRPKAPKAEPFSVLPMLPPGVDMAFVTADGTLLPMDKDPITVGRSDDKYWSFPKDPSVSGNHARIRKIRNGSAYEIEDLGSTNGTFVRGRKVGRSETINPGDIIRIGHKTQIKLVTKAEAALKNTKATRISE